MKPTLAVLTIISLAASSRAQSSIEWTYSSENVVIDTDRVLASAYDSLTFPYVEEYPGVEVIEVRAVADWTVSSLWSATNGTASPIQLYEPIVRRGGGFVFGSPSGVGAGCDVWNESFGGGMIVIPAGQTHVERLIEEPLFQCSAEARAGHPTGSWFHSIWLMMRPHFLQGGSLPTYMGAYYELDDDPTPGVTQTTLVGVRCESATEVRTRLDLFTQNAQRHCTGGVNSTGLTASLDLYGSMNPGPSNLVAQVTGLVPGAPTALVAATQFVSLPGAGPNTCLRGTRLAQIVVFVPSSVARIAIDLSGLAPGQSVAFQCLYRDGAGWNASDLIEESVQ